MFFKGECCVKKIFLTLIVLLSVFQLSGGAHARSSLRFAALGDFQLESGKIIRQCRIGYRVYGTLNDEKSNAILFPTWFSGTTDDLADFAGPGKLIDTGRFFLILADSLGNGVSSFPSNSSTQPGKQFPRFSIRDMVTAQHILLTRKLGIDHLHAVVGISMGGMQTFQWIVSYPGFMDKAVSIAGTPRLTAYDLLLWQTQLRVMEALEKKDHDKRETMRLIAAIHNLSLQTPEHIVARTPPEELPLFLAAQEQYVVRNDFHDWAWQLKAMIGHDIYSTFGGSMERAVSRIKAPVLVVVAQQDSMVISEPARNLAATLGAELVELTGDCGHLAFLCEAEALRFAVTSFLHRGKKQTIEQIGEN